MRECRGSAFDIRLKSRCMRFSGDGHLSRCTRSRQSRRWLTVPLPRPINTGNLIRELWPRHSMGIPIFQRMTDRASQRAWSVQRSVIIHAWNAKCKFPRLSGIGRVDGTRAVRKRVAKTRSAPMQSVDYPVVFLRVRFCKIIPPLADQRAWGSLITEQKSINRQKSLVVKLNSVVAILNRPEVSR